MDTILLQIRSNGQITLPASVRRQARLREGDTLEITVLEDGSLKLIPKLIVDRSQAYFWTEQWQAGEREAEADIRAGRLQFLEPDALLVAESIEEEENIKSGRNGTSPSEATAAALALIGLVEALSTEQLELFDSALEGSRDAFFGPREIAW